MSIVKNLIQEPECPEGDLPEDRTLNVVGSDVALLLVLHLAEALILPADFDDDIPVDFEVSGRDADVLHTVVGTGELVAEVTFTHGPDFRLHG